jgi:hypothetical protein
MAIRLPAPQFFIGRVSASDTGSYNVIVETVGDNLKSPMQGVPLASVFGTTLGFKECINYPVGAAVLCYYVFTSKCYILGIIPEKDIGDVRTFARTALKTNDGIFDEQNFVNYDTDASKNDFYGQNRPSDVVEGELVYANEFGVLLGLFQTMATLKGSELAQVQCYLLDDLVRIISHNYEHFTAMGEFKVWHDGRAIMAELGATHLSGESLGIPQVTSFKQDIVFSEENGRPTPDDSKDYYKFDKDERIKASERLKIFMGKLGDFLHMFIVRPDPEAIRALAGEVQGKFDTGMADVHFGLDGRISIRTVTGASIEKTNWIMVPERVRTADDPNGDDDLEYENKDPFEFDTSRKYKQNPTLFFLQMQDCNAYLQNAYDYKNFIKHEKDFKLSKDPQNQENQIEGIEKVDPNTEVKLSDYQLRRSGVYLMDNGGIMLKDAWGSAIVMEGGDIYLQAAKDLVSQPMRHAITKAGMHINLSARKDVDISSTEEGFRLKTKKIQYFYSLEEGMLLHSDGEKKTNPLPETDGAYENMGGIVLKSKTGIFSYAEDSFARTTSQTLIKSGSLYIEAEGTDGNPNGVHIKSKKNITAIAESFLYLNGGNSAILHSNSGMEVIAQGSLIIGGASATAIGQQGQIIGMVPHPGSFPAILDGVLDIPKISDGFDEIKNAELEINYQETFGYPYQQDDKFEGIEFRFLKSEKYKLSDESDQLPMTIAQQQDKVFGIENLVPWVEVPVKGTYPFPGTDKWNSYYATCQLVNLQKIKNDIYSKGTDGLISKGSTLSMEGMSSYTVKNS